MDPGGLPALGWPPTGAFGTQNLSTSYPPASSSQDGGFMARLQEQPATQRQQPAGMRPNLSTDSLSSYFDSRIVLADSAAAAAAMRSTPSGDDGMEPLEGLDSAALGRLLPDLDASDPDPTAGPSGRASSTEHGAAGPQGRPMRRRIGSVEDDIFSAVGGLELGHDPHDHDGEGSSSAAAAAAALGDHMLGEAPSRTLFVRNVEADVADEEIRSLFQSHGEIRTLYTACKHRGFVVVSYYDLRSAVRAQQLLQGAVLGGRRGLEVHFTTPKGKPESGVNQGTVVVFNLDPDTTDEQLVWIFSKFGEVKDIKESPTRRNQKFIQFYDVRHAAAALKAMNKAELSAPSASGRPPAGASSAGLHSASSGTSSNSASGVERGSGAHGVVATHQHEQQQQQQQLHQHHKQLHQQQAQQAQRGMVRPASGIINTVTGASPVSLGPMSQSWDPATEDSSLLGWLGRGQGAAAVSAAQQQLQQQQQAQQAQQQQQQQQMLRDQAALQQALQQGLQADALLSSLGGGVSMEQLRNASGSTLSKLANAAQLLGASGTGRGANLHVSDSASSIASTSAAGPLFSSAGGAVNAQLQQSLAAQQQQQQQQHNIAAQQQAQQQQQQQQAVEQLARRYGSSDQLQGMESLLAQQAPTATSNLMMNSASFGSGLNLADDANAAAANLLAGSYQTGSYPQLSEQGAGMYGLRSLSNPALAATAAAAAAAQQNAAAAMAGQLWGGGSNAAAAAMLNAQAAAAGMGALGYQELALRQQQQLALQLAGLQAGLQAQGLVGPGALSTAQLLQSAAAAGLLPPTLPGAGGLLPQNFGAAGLGGVPAMGGYGPGSSGMGSRSASTNSLAGMGLSGHLSASSSRHGSAADLSRATSGSGGGGRLSRRATDPAAEAERKAQQDKLFALDLDRIRRGDDRRTTLMIKNIPNKYTQKMLLQTIDEHCHGMYDFFYLPIDFKNKCNVGYAFINMLAPEYIIPLVERFDRRRWDKFNSEKVCHISYARIQGRLALVTHFQNSSLMHEDKRCRPVLFQVEGPEAGEQEPFPVGPNVRPRGAHLSFRDPAPPGRPSARMG